MFFLLLLGTKKYDADKEQINREGYGRMLLNSLPCLFHFFTPMNIIQHHNAICMQVG